jgi:UDP-N-acetylglucosamine--N-acetylmuramyl-(pentapeptide) pyrophosphoryl-undecaprenol N-acetylglucosamine transferase
VLFTGGGTGGHVFPGVAVALNLQSRRPIRILWVGSTGGIEQQIVGRFGIPFSGIPAGKFRRYLSLRNLADIFKIAAGVLRSLSVMRRHRPSLVFSKGGFASVPPVIAAWLRGIPVVTHESDADAGLATRINARFARKILVPYAATAKRFPQKIQGRVVVTGNPIRSEIFSGDPTSGLSAAGFSPADPRPVVMILGGSLGARQLNQLVISIIQAIRPEWRIIHQTGDRSADLEFPVSDESYFRGSFFQNELPHLLACAEAVVCRSGAGTLWEVAALAKPMLLVPLGAGSRGDQERNAEVFERELAAQVFRSDLTLAEDVTGALHTLAIHPENRSRMGRNARQLIHIDSSDQIVAILEELLDHQ